MPARAAAIVVDSTAVDPVAAGQIGAVEAKVIGAIAATEYVTEAAINLKRSISAWPLL